MKRSMNGHKTRAGLRAAAGKKLRPLMALLALAVAVLTANAQAQAGTWDLLTVSNTNTLMRVDINSSTSPFPSTIVGVTQDAPSAGGTVRRIRGLAFAGTTLYGITREGDLVTVDEHTGQTTFVYSIGTGSPTTQFWSGLTYDPLTNALYTVNAFGGLTDQNLVRIHLGPPPTHTVQGATTLVGGTFAFQMLGVAFMDLGGPTPTLLASNRQNENIVEMNPATGEFMFTWGNVVSGVPNPQQIAVNPGTGVLWAINDHSQTSSNASLSTFTPATMQSTNAGELPFGIVETVGGGNDTLGWGGMAFTPHGNATDQVHLTFHSGLCDCFAPPEDPSSPRPELVSFGTTITPNGPSNFDSTNLNEWFAHSFVGLPKGCILRGTLTITVRPLGGGSSNDAFWLGQVDGTSTTLTTDFTGWHFGDVAGTTNTLFPGQPWTTAARPDPCGYTVTIDLNTPVAGGPDTLIDRMNALGVLDVWAQDDTAFDCMVLDLELEPGCIPQCDNPCPADINGDGVVNGADLGSLLNNFGVSCP